MNDPLIMNILLSLVATLFFLLVMILGWLGNKIYSKLSEMVISMRSIEADLHGKISNLDRRVTVVETKMLEQCKK
jgi:hypothetical protein